MGLVVLNEFSRVPDDQLEVRSGQPSPLRSHTSFGQVVYYIPKWAAFKGLWVAPERELQDLLATDRDLPSLYPKG